VRIDRAYNAGGNDSIGLVAPEVVNRVFTGQTELVQRDLALCRKIAEIEYGKVGVTLLIFSLPCNRVADIQNFAGVPAVLQQCQHFRVGNQAERPFIQIGQLAAKHKRRTENRPQRQHGALLGAGQKRVALENAVLAAANGDMADRKHIAIREAAVRYVRTPVAAAHEHFSNIFPAVPEIVGNAPHIGVFAQVVRLFHHGRSGRKTQHNIAAAMLNCCGDHFDFFSAGIVVILIDTAVNHADVIYLDEIDAPRSVQLEQRVVIGLCADGNGIKTVHIRVPGADRSRVSNITRMNTGTLDGYVFCNRLTRNAAHDVNAEFQSLAVNVVSNRFEAFSVCGGGKTIWGGHQTAVFVHAELSKGVIGGRICGRLRPLNIAYNVFPAIGLQMLCHIIRVSDEVLFRNGGTVAVPAVPAHRRIDSKQVLVHNYPSFINHVNLKLYDQIRLVCLDKLDYSTIIKSIK